MSKKFFIIITVLAVILLVLVAGFFVWQKRNIISYESAQGSTPSLSAGNDTTTILSFGDMMLDRNVRQKINENGAEYPFALIKDFIAGNDIVVANSEGSFTHNKSLTLGKKDAPLAFTFDPNMLATLKNIGFDLLDQANNHTLNFGTAGLKESETAISVAGLNYFGDPSNKNVAPYVVEVNGEKIGFIGYHEFAYKGLDNVLNAIKDAKKNLSYVAVYAHWGDEYKLNFNASQQKTARAFIDAGADVVIGAHPHVTEPIEIYKNKIIFYSLGNFIFDQAANAPTGRGLAIKTMLKKDFAIYEIFPISIVHAQAALMENEARQTELDALAKSSVVSNDRRNDIISGTIILSR